MDPRSEQPLPHFHHANIHEQRFAAYVVRALPMSILLVMLAVVCLGVFRFSVVLLVICAVLNVSMWFWICSVALLGIWGSISTEEELLAASLDCAEPNVASGVLATQETAGAADKPGNAVVETNLAPDPEGQDDVRHVVIFPNFEETEEMLAETLESLSEAIGSKDFFVVLAMEEREGTEGKEKAQRLTDKYKDRFARIIDSYHKANLMEEHDDGTSDLEVPGKASNLKSAVKAAYEQCKLDSRFDPENVVLTVADADCFFHPSYFARVSGDFRGMRAVGDQHRWTMWQAPQLPFRNYYISPMPARVWGYISSLYEFGGVSGLTLGGHHMVFSAYSLHLQLAVQGRLWDGDVIAEDHHAFIKAFLYSAWASASEVLQAKDGCGQGCRPALQVRPVMLPVKSTSVVDATGYWQSWVARWNQALRHCQGVAELSYSLLATWDLICSIPMRVWTFELAFRLFRVVSRPIFIHIMPICQAFALGVLTLFWLYHHRTVPHCPDRVWLADSDRELLLCGMAGAWALFWPVAIPLALLAFSNFLFLRVAFQGPSASVQSSKHKTLWHTSDGGVPQTFGSRSITLGLLIFVDCAFLMGPVMTFYGLVAEVLGCWNVMLRGNRFKYITATKATSMVDNYGSTSSAEAIGAPRKAEEVGIPAKAA